MMTYRFVTSSDTTCRSVPVQLKRDSKRLQDKELEYTALHREESTFPKWGVRVGVVLLLPED